MVERMPIHSLRLKCHSLVITIIVGSSFLPFVSVMLYDLIVELLEHVSLESHEYVNEILPTIQQSYKDVSSKAQFLYTRPRLVHNSRLQDNVSCHS